ncbi:hypothetical protein [Saccharothrix texasensis]|uniref:hypothetical protein n=1 Tax=Saccharothrix texasensis TaxID=103734 RepID=UPI0014771A48|nr:hypothetical protein [Saccharothrix texasensis]
MPAREPRIDVGIAPGALDADAGWVLMASEDLARATPPDDVVDCRGLREWALREGALPVGDAPHTIGITANYRTTVESVQVHVVSDPAPYTGGTPSVRLVCLPRPDADLPFPESDAARIKAGGGTGLPFSRVPERVALPGPHEVTPRSPAEVEVVVDLTGTPGPFAYRIGIDVVEQNELRRFPMTEPMFATEDGGGMGYWPATATWTMSPDRTRTYCEPVTNPAPDAKPTCA